MLTPDEQRVLRMYRNPAASGMGRATRLSIQYAIGAGVFVYLCIATKNVYWSLAVYGIFLLQLLVRLRGTRMITGVMPGIIAKYDQKIAELEAQLPPPTPAR